MAVAGGSGEVVPIRNTAFTGKVKLREAVLLRVSVTVAEKVIEPPAGGVPVKRPPDVKVR